MTLSESTSNKSPQFLLCAIVLLTSLLLLVIVVKVIKSGIGLTPDSFIYLDSAINIAHGRGCVHSFVLTSEVCDWDGIRYIPMGYWAPGYPYFLSFWLRIFRLEDGKWLEIIQGFLMWITYLSILFFPIYGSKENGLISLLFCLITYPFTYLFSWFWSETLSTLVFFAFLFWSVKALKSGKLYAWYILGVMGGIAFAIKYVLIALFLFGYVLLIIETLFYLAKGIGGNKIGREKINLKIFLAKLVLFSVGWGICAVPLLIRNYNLTGAFLGYTRERSEISLLENLSYAISAILNSWFDPKFVPLEIQPQIIVVFILFFTLFVVLRGRYGRVINWICSWETLILLLWAIFYIGVVVVYSSIYNIDIIGVRLLSPAFLSLILLVSGLVSEVFGITRVLCIVLCGLGILVFSVSYPYRSDDFPPLRELSQKERVKWVCRNTTAEDLILGDSTFDLTIFCGTRRSVCFVPGSKKDLPPDYEMVKTIHKNLDTTKGKLYVVVRKALPLDKHFKSDWNRWFGEFLTELIFKGTYKDFRVSVFSKGKEFISFEIIEKNSQDE